MVRGPLELEMKAKVGEVLNRWPTAGLAVGVVRNGSLEWFYGHGVADIASKAPVTEDTVFRIASITKTFTAIAVMQLWEQGLVDLDAPANDYLRAYQLVPAKASFRPATVRHLLTHTAGVRAVRRASDLLRPALGWGAPVGRPAPSLAEYYRGGLRVDVEPGTKWAYSNHGFATLGQIVEDVSGIPFDRYLRERMFGPLGMESSDLVRSERVRPRLATGYELRLRRTQGGRRPRDRDSRRRARSTPPRPTWLATSRRFWAAAPTSTAPCSDPRRSPRCSSPTTSPIRGYRAWGWGSSATRSADTGPSATTGSGRASARTWCSLRTRGSVSSRSPTPAGSTPAARRCPSRTRSSVILLGLPDDAVRTDVPEHPEVWSDLCGWYSFGPGVLTDPQPRAMLGAGVEVVVRRDHLTIRGQMPIPAVRKGLRLYPDGDDPYAFRIDLSGFGAGTSPVVFSREPGGEVTALHLGLAPMSFQKRPDVRNPRPWVNGALAAGATALAARGLRVHVR